MRTSFLLFLLLLSAVQCTLVIVLQCSARFIFAVAFAVAFAFECSAVQCALVPCTVLCILNHYEACAS